jgi:hypothetical protein
MLVLVLVIVLDPLEQAAGRGHRRGKVRLI